MTLLKEMIATGAVTGAGAVAGTRGSIFGNGVTEKKKDKKKKKKTMIRRVVGEAISPNSEETNFDSASVLSKIDSAEKKSRSNEDTVAFRLEDDNGEVVKVYVSQDQAADFEQALGVALSDDGKEGVENSSVEIAEILFKLKDRFEIIDVEWNEFSGDEEEEQIVGDDEASDDEASDGEMSDDPTEEAATSALQSVIDVMKADADAKQAEAKAKEAEANAKEAEYAAKSSAEKVQQEEQILDMEAHNKAESTKKKEATQLAKLAKFKHDTATDAETKLSTESVGEDEEEVEDASGISLSDLSTLMMSRLRAN